MTVNLCKITSGQAKLKRYIKNESNKFSLFCLVYIDLTTTLYAQVGLWAYCRIPGSNTMYFSARIQTTSRDVNTDPISLLVSFLKYIFNLTNKIKNKKIYHKDFWACVYIFQNDLQIIFSHLDSVKNVLFVLLVVFGSNNCALLKTKTGSCSGPALFKSSKVVYITAYAYITVNASMQEHPNFNVL